MRRAGWAKKPSRSSRAYQTYLHLDVAILTWTLLALAALAGSSAISPRFADTAVVTGTVTVPESTGKRWATRYPGAGIASARLHAVRPVVYLTGDLPASTGPAATIDLRQEGGRFAPGALAVRTGTVVRFPNADAFYHNVFSYSGPRFDLGRYPRGESRTVTLDRAGVVEIFCEIHEFMRAVVVVTDHPHHAVVAPDGSFRLEGVPPGDYTLHVYHPDWDALEVAVTVRDGQSSDLVLALGG